MTTAIAKFAQLQIPLEDVVNATNNFHQDNVIGRGGLGSIYKGELLRSGELIKISALRLDRKQKDNIQFWTEISMLSDLKHTNIVSIIGFCDEKHEKIIITTYAAKGSLKEHLDNPNLTWTQRLKISVGVARALTYLHYDESRGYGVTHLNINSSTILLDENWEAKLSGFKVSIKHSLKRMEQVILCEPIGTKGYVDPELPKTKGVTHKSDVYAFGVVLFEILCGRKAFISNDDNKFLARWAKYHYENETLNDIVQHDLRNNISVGSLRKYSKTAYSCLKEERAHRPHMPDIVDELEKALKKALVFQPRLDYFGKKLEHLKIRLDDIKLATHNFSDTYKTRVGYYHIWYMAELRHFDKENPSFVEGKSKSELTEGHTNVVIKRFLHVDEEEDEEIPFLSELDMLSSVKHQNIVTLLGFCVEGFEMILVTENLHHRFLMGYLGNVENLRTLTWTKRLNICIDLAHALNYLHSEMDDKKMIVHGNIYINTFGLDENNKVKIKDFGWAVFLPQNERYEALSKIRKFESKHHVDPEYEKTAMLKTDSDVYSFGVVLFEILCGRHAHDEIYLKESEKGLVHVARQSFYNGTIEDMIDPTLKEENGQKGYTWNRGANKYSLNTFIKVANQCVKETQDERPTMEDVYFELQFALFYQLIFQAIQYPLFSFHELVREVGRWLKKLMGFFIWRASFDEYSGALDNKEELLQQLDQDQIVDALENENSVDSVRMDKVVDKLHPMHEIVETKLEHLMIRLSDIQLATQNFYKTIKINASFEEKFTLYRAKLDHFDKGDHSSNKGKNKGELPKRQNTVIIKRYISENKWPREDEFFTEIEMLTCVKHPNIVTLLGFCLEGSERILVTENVSNGYLTDYLTKDNDMRILTWERRLKICIDIAHALKYLHSEMEDQKVMIHRDIISKNIGLDENWGAKIVAFGLSVFLPPNQDEALYLNSIGRPFYIDPEYKKTSKLKRESDVYSFGVVLFEILCGRLAFDKIYRKESEGGLPSIARRSFCMGTLKDIIDPIIKEDADENNFVLHRGPTNESLDTFIKIAYQCVAETQEQRPTMKVVVKELEKALFFQKNNKDNPRVSLLEIIHATQNFHKDNCIGRGGFGKVYRGNLQDGDVSKTIVAKQLDTRFGQGEQQFLTELQILLEYKHENVIGLIGYCDEKNEKILVYEYAPKGSLDRYLNDVSLTWVERLNICIDVASALYFLHGGFGRQAKVIHRDIKSANILLNHEWKAKLADFGLSLISPLTHEIDYVINYAWGTPGYLDPVYGKSGFLTIESDIYSFGVVLFELLCGRSTLTIHKNEGHYLPDFIRNKFEEGKLDEVVFEQLREHIEPKSLTTFQKIAYQCLHHERQERPTTKKVLIQLKKALSLQNMSSAMTRFANLQISLEDVVKATNNFHHDNIIRHDGFSTSYKGQLLRSGKLMRIAARRFDSKRGEGDVEFLTEISVLSDLKHTNLVSLIGFCEENDEKIIVTMYEAKGSLGQFVNNPNLTWTQRLRICVGVARALRYLHYDEGRDNAVIHCNINSYTILIDDNWEAKLSSFEFSIEQSKSDRHHLCLCEHTSTMDPSIEKTGGVTTKSDIYSFGVVLLETLCGRKAFEEYERSLAHHIEKKTLHDIIFPNLLDQMVSPQSLIEYSKAAYSCLNVIPGQHPDIHSIMTKLEKALKLQLRCENIEKKLEHLKVPLSDIKLATNNFSDKYRSTYWRGVYTLYKAELDHFDKENPLSKKKNKGEHPKGHNTVVIKRYPFESDLYGEEEFYTEIEVLSSIKHPNIVTLFGFCLEGSEMILVRENLSNGFLIYHLEKVHQRSILTWEKRLKICIDVAHALKYLHSEMVDQKTIICRDLSSSSIHLDENWDAKIVDFSFSVYLPPNQEDEALYLNWIGKPFYTDPEYNQTFKLKRESDVYSFGVVLFEMLCGRKAEDPIYEKQSNKGLATVARQSYNIGTLDDMIDPMLKEETSGTNKDSLNTFIEIAYQCVRETQVQRPKMEIVVKELEKALLLQVPPKQKVNDQSLTNVKDTTSTQIEHPNLCTDEWDKCLEMSESQKKEVEDYVYSYKTPAKEIFMNRWISQQREYFVVLCQKRQINPEDMDDDEAVA